MSVIELLIGSLFLFLGIKLSLMAQELHMLGFRKEGRTMTELAITMALLGFVLWSMGTPTPEEALAVDPDAFWTT